MDHMRIGFIQMLTSLTNYAEYRDGKWLRSDIQGNYGRKPVLDTVPDKQKNSPLATNEYYWYINDKYPETVLRPKTKGSAAKDMTASDEPVQGPPLYSTVVAHDIEGRALRSLYLENHFTTFVCAETTDMQNGANLVFTARAQMSWVFNGTGPVPGPRPTYAWDKSNAKVTKPQRWDEVQDGSSPVPRDGSRPEKFNDMLDRQRFG